jgi:signal transduction histidine kinase
MDPLDEILATVHDLKSPLLAIERLSERLLEHEESLSEQSQRKLELIYESALKASGYLEDLNVSCDCASDESTDTGTVNLVHLAREVVERCKGHAESKAQTLHLAVSHSQGVQDCVVSGKPSQLRKAMTNLVDNALKYSPDGETVEVWVSRCEEGVAFSVSDNGPGLEPGEHDRLFEPFEQGRARPTGEEGASGLGLYLVKQILRRHGGDIEVESTEGKGSTFTLLFPPVSSGASSSASGQESQVEAADASTTTVPVA